MIGVAIGARVECTDGPGGTCTHLIVRSLKVTRIVVKPHLWRYLPAERSVPFGQIIASAPGVIWLSCTRAELGLMESYYEQAHAQSALISSILAGRSPAAEAPDFLEQQVAGLHLPRLESDEHVFEENISVEATDGIAGIVGELLVESSDGTIAHMLVCDRHTEIAVPIRAVSFTDHNRVHLNVDRRALTAFPSVPAPRRVRRIPMTDELIQRALGTA